MTIRDWPTDERPREKLLMRGSAALSDAELLALLLGSGGRGEDAVARGRTLLSRFGSLRGLLRQPVDALLATPGLGQAQVCRLLGALEIGRRHWDEALLRGEPLSDPVAAGTLFRRHLRDLPHEVFACLYLDNRNRTIAFEELFRGSIDGAEVHPRVVVQRCLHHHAAAVMFGHNHPSGVAEPSAADRGITLRLREALALIDVRVLDHFVIGDGAPVSLAARGLL